MEIQLGMYVRNDKGMLGKLMGSHAYDDDKVAIIVGKTEGGVLITPTIDKKTIVKASYNILDLLEPMDLMYIDVSPDDWGGIVVPRVAECLAQLETWKEKFTTGECILKGIVTKERLQNNWYWMEEK